MQYREAGRVGWEVLLDVANVWKADIEMFEEEKGGHLFLIK